MAVKDTNHTDDILKRFAKIEGKELAIGIQGDEAEAYHVDSRGKKTARMIVIAGANEYGCNTGTTTIPERSFIRGTFDAHKETIARESVEQLQSVIEGTISSDVAFTALGERYESLTKEFLTELSNPANAQATIDAKGSSNPLIDTGRLRNSITHKVGDKRAK